MALNGQTVRVVPRERTLPDGTPVKHGDYAERPAIPWPGALVLPDTSSEQIQGGQLVESRWRIVGPVGVTARPQDVVEVDGLEPGTLRLHVDGRLQTRADLHGRPHHVEGLLVEWKG